MRVDKKSAGDVIKGLSEDIKDRERREQPTVASFFLSHKLIPKSQQPK
jgi:hypothetical protein